MRNSRLCHKQVQSLKHITSLSKQNFVCLLFLVIDSLSHIKRLFVVDEGLRIKTPVDSAVTTSVQFRSVTQACPTLSDPMDCSTPGLPVHHQLLEFTQSSCPLSWWCHPTISSSVVPFSPSVFPRIRVFSNESALRIRWPKYWSFSFNSSPSNEHPGLISFRMYWLDLLAVQGTLKSLLQHHSSKA